MSVTSSGSRVTAAWDTVLNQQLSFGYDDMDRLSSRTVTAGSPQSFTYSYDRWGNRVNQVAIHSGPSMSTSFSTGTNQIGNANGNTYAYDAAGNVQSDGTYTYTHDAEGNLTGVSGLTTATYVYDALNHRVETVTSAGTQQFLFDAQGKRQATLDGSGNALSEQSYLGSAPLAFFQGGSFHFQHQDWLGTERIRTSQTGTAEGTYSSLPFGDGYTTTGSDQDPAHYTGLDRDAETGNSHAMFRDYNSATGTWMRPDPYAGSYDFSNPQSLNRFAYVMNQPIGALDPTGLAGNFWDSAGCYNSYQTVATRTGTDGVTEIQMGWVTTCPDPVQVGYDPGFAGSGTIGSQRNAWPTVNSTAPSNLFNRAIAYEKRVISCNFSTEKKNAITLGLDGLGFVPGEKLLGATGGVIAMVGIGLASTANSAIEGDTKGFFGGQAGTLLAAIAPAAKYAGMRAAESIPGIGTILNVGVTVRDLYHAHLDYNDCMAGH